jgi:hypothetical protein
MISGLLLFLVFNTLLERAAVEAETRQAAGRLIPTTMPRIHHTTKYIRYFLTFPGYAGEIRKRLLTVA